MARLLASLREAEQSCAARVFGLANFAASRGATSFVRYEVTEARRVGHDSGDFVRGAEMSSKFRWGLMPSLLFLLAANSPDQRAAILLGQQKCQEEPSYCTMSVPAYGGGSKIVHFPCTKKVCQDKKH